MSLVYEDGQAADVPGVHAIVIGVGHYRHLPGGADENLFLSPDINMGQLSSPPQAARHMAKWVLDTWAEDAEMPLRSLRLLISQQEAPASFAHPLVERRTVDEAVMDNIENAITQWARAGKRSADNMMVFYFCGHGVATGVDHPLLASDVAKFEDNMFRHALNFSEFRAGMLHNPALKQLYFVDACRVGSPELVEMAEERGLSVIARKNEIPNPTPLQPTVKSTLQGQEAFGLGQHPSPFAQAVPKVFTGGAWRQTPQGWVVCASMLGNAIDARVREVLVPLGFEDIPEADPHTPKMTLKTVSGDPLVPVEVSCSDSSFLLQARFSCSSGNEVVQERREPAQANWFLEVPRALYDFAVSYEDAAQPDGVRNEFVSPPCFPCQFETSDA